MAVAIIFLLSVAIVIVIVVSNYRLRDVQRQGDVRVAQASQAAEMRAAEAIRQRDIHVATYRHKDADVVAARHEALTRSRAVVSGKVQEHLAPLFPEFISQFNPREARFIGTPVDYVAFNGLDEGECEVVLLEVKTGRSQLSQRERRVRRAVEDGRVRWLELRLPEEVTGVPSGLITATSTVTPPLPPPPFRTPLPAAGQHSTPLPS